MEMVYRPGDEFSHLQGAEGEAFQQQLLRLEESGIDHITLDMSGISSVGSFTLGSIFSANQTLAGRGGRLKLVNCSATVLKQLRLMRLDTFLLAGGEEEAGSESD